MIDRKIEEYKDIVKNWEHEAERRKLTSCEIDEWMKARKMWIEKNRMKTNFMKQRASEMGSGG